MKGDRVSKDNMPPFEIPTLESSTYLRHPLVIPSGGLVESFPISRRQSSGALLGDRVELESIAKSQQREMLLISLEDPGALSSGQRKSNFMSTRSRPFHLLRSLFQVSKPGVLLLTVGWKTHS